MGKRRIGAAPSIVGFRPTPNEFEKLKRLAQKTGLNVTDVFRALLDAADTEPVEVWRPVVKAVQR